MRSAPISNAPTRCKCSTSVVCHEGNCWLCVYGRRTAETQQHLDRSRKPTYGAWLSRKPTYGTKHQGNYAAPVVPKDSLSPKTLRAEDSTRPSILGALQVRHTSQQAVPPCTAVVCMQTQHGWQAHWSSGCTWIKDDPPGLNASSHGSLSLSLQLLSNFQAGVIVVSQALHGLGVASHVHQHIWHIQLCHLPHSLVSL